MEGTAGDAGDAPSSAAWAALAVLTLINLFNYLDRYVVPAVAESIARSPSSAPRTARLGQLFSAFFVVYMVAAPIFGAYGGRVWRLRLVAGGVALWSIATAAGGLAHSYGALLGSRGAVGIGEARICGHRPRSARGLFPGTTPRARLRHFYAAIPVGGA